MLIVRSAGPAVVPYLLDGRHPGEWSNGAGRLLGLHGPVTARDLHRVLQGCDPSGGCYLPAHKPARRRSGWDLIFGAPKSVSLLAAAAGPLERSVSEAHTGAVGAVIGYLDGAATYGQPGRGRSGPGDGLIAASFDHYWNAADEPHLHSHVVVANLTRAAGRWSAVNPDDWYVNRQALSALYQLQLRHQLELQGWHLDWRLRPDGLADLASVGTAVTRAASSQSLLARRTGRFDARRAAVAQPWRDRIAAIGSPLEAAVPAVRPGGGAAVGGGPPTPPRQEASFDEARLEQMVTTRLATRRSDFRRADVLVALAACHQGGMPVEKALTWADRFCAQSCPVPSTTRGRRWTSDLARRSDLDVSGRLLAPVPPTSPPVPTPGGEAIDRLPGLPEGARAAAARLLSGGRRVVVLTAPPGQSRLLAQAEVLDACRTAWEREGLTVSVDSCGGAAGRRWEALAGLAPHRPGERTDILIVDQADRRLGPELGRLAGSGNGARQVILVEGGTLPALSNPVSHGFVAARRELEALDCGFHHPWALPAPTSSRAHDLSPARAAPAPPTLTGRTLAADALASWIGHWSGAETGPLLVGLGLEEVRGLNRAARLICRGGDGPDVGLTAGDRVVVLRGGCEGLRYGMLGRLEACQRPSWAPRWWPRKSPRPRC